MLVLVVSSRGSNFGLTKRCACLICESEFTSWGCADYQRYCFLVLISLSTCSVICGGTIVSVSCSF